MKYGPQLCAEFDGRIPVRCVVERKFDGILALWDGADLWKRRGDRITKKFPEIRPPANMVLLGEVVCFAAPWVAPVDTARDDFGAVEGRVMRENPVDIRLASRARPAHFIAFDVLAVDGADVQARRYEERRRALDAAARRFHSAWNGEGHVVVPPIYPCGSREALEAHLIRAVSEGWEGVVLKDLDAPYAPTPPDSKARPPHYLKFKLWEQRWFPILRWERTESGGFVVFVANKGREQKVALGSVKLQEQVVAGAAKSVFVRFLIHGSEAAEPGAMRQATVRAVSHQVKEGTEW